MKKNYLFKQKEILLMLFILFIINIGNTYSQNKFLGNIHSYYDDPNYTAYWNQVTPENAGKWSSCESKRDQYNWDALDKAYEFAQSKGLLFKQHTFIWGNQYPLWMDDLSKDEQFEEVEEWIKDFGERYPDCDFIDVVNEPLPGHNPAPFREALGGNGKTGWDWVITSFELARKYCPNAKLLLNDFGIINNPSAAIELANIATILKNRNLIDGIGLQCHSFNINNASTNTINEVLDILSDTDLPIYISELDMDGSELIQLNRYEEKFPVLWNHWNVKGITLWGYRKDHMWMAGAWLYNESDNTNRLALDWLKSFIINSEPSLIVPGRIETEKYFRQNGIDTIRVNNSVVMNKINNTDWSEYILNVLCSEKYNIDIKISNPIDNSNISLIIDDKIINTIAVTKITDILTLSTFLDKGKHTFKLLFSNTTSEKDMMEIDWIDIFGPTKYFTCEATSDENGSIYPKGTVYVAQGDDVTFTFDANTGYKPDSILVNGVNQNPSPKSFTIYNVTENKTIVPQFITCNQNILNPYFKINENEFINGSNIIAIELDTVTLKTEFDETGTTYWIDKSGNQSFENEFSIENIQKSQEGIYNFYHSDYVGCKSNIQFDISVEYLVMDVYQAEDFENQSGVQIEDAQDLGGGKNIGYIEDNDWCSYKITIDSTGVYNFIVRAATNTNGGKIEITSNNTILGTARVKNSKSDGWQDWYTTEPVEIELNKGLYDLKLIFKGTDALFNLNWFDITYKEAISPTLISDNINDNYDLQVYPNPCKNIFNINYKLNSNSYIELKIIDINGKVIKSLIKEDNQTLGSYTVTCDLEGLSNGIYFLNCIINNKVETKKLLIQN